MYNSFKTSLSNWNNSTSDREKLQHAYVAVALILLIVAGVFGLLNQALGQQILAGAIIAAGIFLINAISWALLQSLVLLRVDTQVTTVKAVKAAPQLPKRPLRKKEK